MNDAILQVSIECPVFAVIFSTGEHKFYVRDSDNRLDSFAQETRK